MWKDLEPQKSMLQHSSLILIANDYFRFKSYKIEKYLRKEEKLMKILKGEGSERGQRWDERMMDQLCMGQQ